jgi:hypothetical protein
MLRFASLNATYGLGHFIVGRCAKPPPAQAGMQLDYGDPILSLFAAKRFNPTQRGRRPMRGRILSTGKIESVLFLFVLILGVIGFPEPGRAQPPERTSALFSLNSPPQPSPAEQVLASQPKRSLGELLRTDGAIDLETGFRGSLDGRGYRLASSADETPRFEAVAASGDELWDGRFGLPATNGAVLAMVVDGAGHLHIGGRFTRAGGLAVSNIARWNGSNWSALGSGVDGVVRALALVGSGNLYVGGGFTQAGGVTARHIAKWDGSNWSSLGSGMNGSVLAMATDGSGNLYAGGYFTQAGGVAARHIAKWDGSNWSALGSGVNGSVSALAVVGSGKLFAGGSFTDAGGVAANRIARWNGTAWSAMGLGANDTVLALARERNGGLYIGGSFSTAGGKPSSYIGRWTGDICKGIPSILAPLLLE